MVAFGKGGAGKGSPTQPLQEHMFSDHYQGGVQSQGQQHKRRGSGRKSKGGKQKEAAAGPSLTEGSAMPQPFSKGYSNSKFRASEAQMCVAGFIGPEHAIDFAQQTATAAEQEDKYRPIQDVIAKAEASRAQDKLSEKECLDVFTVLNKRMRELAFASHGCRLVQRAMDVLDFKHQVMLVKELKSKTAQEKFVFQALQDPVYSPHANHVLQKCIELLPPEHVGFILDELTVEQCGKASDWLACHKYGCRVLERFLEHFDPKQMGPFLSPVIEESKKLCKDQYGNFVIQHVLEHGSEEQQSLIVQMLMDNLEDMVTDNHACSVLSKALSYPGQQLQRKLALAIVQEGLLGKMAAKSQGHGGIEAADRLLKVLQEDDAFPEAKRQLMEKVSELQSKQGKALIASFAPEMCSDEPLPSQPHGRGPAPWCENRRHMMPRSNNRPRKHSGGTPWS